jgi:class 3 adenylate cyclase/tetratricopeptide (TPR) repeat protein
VTVLFADVSGFTAMSEHMDPEDVKGLADRWANRLSEVVRRFGGTVISVVGDEIYAVFGAPVAHEDDAERAVRAGLAMRELNLSDDPNRPIKVHVGINTGEGMAGWIGPEGRRDYTVMGDTTNTGARLLKAAPSATVLVGESTYKETKRLVHYDEVNPIIAKGKDKPVRAWEALEMMAGPKARPLGTAPLIGRDSELTRLENMWLRVSKESQPHLVTIVGEPGMGKSRLVAEFEQRLPSGVTVWHGRCLPYGEALGYWALAIALKEAAGITAEDEIDSARAKLDRLVAATSNLEGDPIEVARHLALLTGLDVEADRSVNAGDQRILHASVRRFLEAFARQQPLCLIFDDIQWADDALLDLIESVAARVHDTSLLMITQARPELMEKRTAWGRNVSSFTSMPLGSLNELAEQELILSLCKERGIPEALAAQIGRSPGGNPLFAEEMVAMMAEGGPMTGVPSVIKMLIAARLDTLPSEERTLIQLAAIFGKIFWEGGLRAIQRRISTSLDEAIEELEQKNLLRAVAHSQIRGDNEYTFKHDLIRDVAYEMLPKVERRELHGRAADWLETAAGEQVENYFDQLAHHAVQAGQQERAINYLIRAAERAGRAAAHRQAAALFGQAIILAESLGQRALLADLHAKRGKAFVNVGMWLDARPDLEAALTELPQEAMEQRALVLIDLATVSFWINDIPSMRRYSTEAMSTAQAVNRDDIVAGALGALALAHSSEGELDSIVDLSEKAVELAGDTPIGAVTFGVAIRGFNYYWVGQFDNAINSTRESVEIARKMNDSLFISYALPHVGLPLAAKGNYLEAQKIFDEARRFSREYEIWPMLARAISMSAGYHLDIFDFSGHDTIAKEALELARSVTLINPIVSTSIDLLFNYVRCEEVGQAEKIIGEVAETVQKAAGSHGWLWRLRLAEARAELALARDDYEGTLRLVEDAIAQSQSRGRVKYQAFGLETRAKALAALGRKKEAIVAAQNAVKLLRPIGAPALFLRAAATLIDLEGNDKLLAEARSATQQIMTALPNDELRRTFRQAEPVRLVLQ